MVALPLFDGFATLKVCFQVAEEQFAAQSTKSGPICAKLCQFPASVCRLENVVPVEVLELPLVPEPEVEPLPELEPEELLPEPDPLLDDPESEPELVPELVPLLPELLDPEPELPEPLLVPELEPLLVPEPDPLLPVPESDPELDPVLDPDELELPELEVLPALACVEVGEAAFEPIPPQPERNRETLTERRAASP